MQQAFSPEPERTSGDGCTLGSRLQQFAQHISLPQPPTSILLSFPTQLNEEKWTKVEFMWRRT